MNLASHLSFTLSSFYVEYMDTNHVEYISSQGYSHCFLGEILPHTPMTLKIYDYALLNSNKARIGFDAEDLFDFVTFGVSPNCLYGHWLIDGNFPLCDKIC